MRELRIYKGNDYESTLIYDQEKDGSSEEAMWSLDKFLYDLKAGDTLQIYCVR